MLIFAFAFFFFFHTAFAHRGVSHHSSEALEFSFGYVDKHPEFVPTGMTRDCAVAVVLYTFGEYLTTSSPDPDPG